MEALREAADEVDKLQRDLADMRRSDKLQSGNRLLASIRQAEKASIDQLRLLRAAVATESDQVDLWQAQHDAERTEVADLAEAVRRCGEDVRVTKQQLSEYEGSLAILREEFVAVSRGGIP